MIFLKNEMKLLFSFSVVKMVSPFSESDGDEDDEDESNHKQIEK